MSDRIDVTILREKVDAAFKSEYQVSAPEFYQMALAALLIFADTLVDIKQELERRP